MTETPPAPEADELLKVTAEGGPHDGERFTTTRATRTLNTLAIKDGDTWVAPRKWAADHGIEIGEDASPRAWPPDVRQRVVQVEYLIDHDHGTAAFREPAQIRETAEAEPEREWAVADPRKTQEARWIAWKAIATALGALPSLDDPPCTHTPPCTSVAMCVARVAMDAVVADGLRFVEPTRLAAPAETLAILIHDTYEALAPEHDWQTQVETRTDWANVPENNRNLMIDVAQHVLGSLDAHGRIVVIDVPETAPLDMDFEGLANVLRDEAGAALTLALPAQLGITMRTLDEGEMLEHGWMRVPPPEPVVPVEFGAGPLARSIYTSCPHCDASLTVEFGEDNGLAARATAELGGALHDHLNDEHPNDEHREVTVHLLEGPEIYEVTQ
jgi:hypothetical protein